MYVADLYKTDPEAKESLGILHGATEHDLKAVG